MDHVDKDLFPHETMDYELNVALKHGHNEVVTGIGAFRFAHPPSIPFTLMITRKRA
jgi:hypothetical protein